MLEAGKIVFGVISLISMYSMFNIQLPEFLESIKNNESIIKIFSFYYVYDLTQNILISILSVMIIEMSRIYQKEVMMLINRHKDKIISEKDKISNRLRSGKGIENFTNNFFK